MPTSLTGFNVFVPLTVIESAKVNENFSAFRGTLIPVADNTAASADNFYDLGTSTWRWKNQYLSGAMILSQLTTTASPAAGALALYNRLGTITIRDSNGLEYAPPTWSKYSLTFATLSAATTTAAGTLFNAQPNECIHAYRVKTSTVFAGTSLTSVSFDLGITGIAAKYVDGYLLSDAVTTTSQALSNDIDVFDATTAVTWQAVGVGANLSALSTGSMTIWVLKSLLP